MTSLPRFPLFPLEFLLYGPSYAVLQYLIRSPKPLEAEPTWELITREPPPAMDWFRKAYPPPFMRGLALRAKIRQDHIVGISKHYDVSNDFYELFLDKKYMFYTSADFDRDDETLEDAQTRKADRIMEMLDPQSGEKILDLGCGWGAMLKRISQETGDREKLYGYTLSKEQVAYNDEHNHFNVELRNFVTTDYPDEFYDKLYSIGAWQHVRPKEILPLLKKLNKTLKPQGRMLHHFFCRPTDKLFASIACGQLFFPGALGSSFRFHSRAFEDAGFRTTYITVSDYRPTLRAWFDNLVANRERAIDLVGVRTYNRYLVFFPASWRYFQDAFGIEFRWVLEKN